MDGLYEVSASEKVKALEEELKKELKELQNELEDIDLLGRSPPKAVRLVRRILPPRFIFKTITYSLL